ncbi:Tankyrase-1-like protein, partial [Leptotrombidium deliense]
MKSLRPQFSKRPEDYLNNQEGISVQVLRENAIVSKPIGHRISRRTDKRVSEQQSWSKTNSTKSVMHRSNIKELIKQGNLTAIEEIVIQGFGDRLIGETSSAPLVQEFLDRVPALIEQITEIHKAAAKGNINEFKSLLDRKGIILARDQIGATPLHKSVLYGHQELTDYIANNFPSSLDARDHEGRTPLHYAAVLDDDRLIFNHLVKAGASPLLPDYRGKSAEYYQRYPDQLNITQLIKRSQRLNANYAINTANRVKSKSPLRKRGWSPNSRKSEPGISGPRSDAGLSDDQECGEVDDGSSNGSAGSATNVPFRFEVTSANLKRWIEEQDFEAIEGAILEGHGERVRDKVEILDTKADTVQNYLEETFPKIMNKIRIIHAAVSCGDISGLQNHLDKNDYALAKDHLGMAPLHKAVILGHIDVVQFILDRFPETINARDREGRTALHYAAATTNRNGAKIYKILLRAGADPRVRDTNNKTAEYYRVHLLPLPSELSKLSVNSKRRQTLNGVGLSPITKRRQILLPSIQEKITNALHDGDATQLQDLVLEGYGDAILGRSSWGEEARKFLKNLPHFMDNIKTLQASIANGDLTNCQRILQNDKSSCYLRAKDENGLLPIHAAVYRNEREIVEFILNKVPSMVNVKDNYGRTPLHIAAQHKYTDLYKKLVELGGDPKILDLKGRTADHYLKVQSYDASRINSNNSNNSNLAKQEKNSAASLISAVDAVEDNVYENYDNDFEKEQSDVEDANKTANANHKAIELQFNNHDKTTVENNAVIEKSKESIKPEKTKLSNQTNHVESKEINKNKNDVTNESSEGKSEDIKSAATGADTIQKEENKHEEEALDRENTSESVELIDQLNSEISEADKTLSEENKVNSSESKTVVGKKSKTKASQKRPQNSIRKQMTVVKPPVTEKKPLNRKASLPSMSSNKVTKTQTKTKITDEIAEETTKNISEVKNPLDNKPTNGEPELTVANLELAKIVAEKIVEDISTDAKAEMQKNLESEEVVESKNDIDQERKENDEIIKELERETSTGETIEQKSVDTADTVIEN